MPQAIGLIETRGLDALNWATDADARKQRTSESLCPVTQWLVMRIITAMRYDGDVAAFKAADGRWRAAVIKAIKGELISVHVIARPHNDVEAVLPKKK